MLANGKKWGSKIRYSPQFIYFFTFRNFTVWKIRHIDGMEMLWDFSPNI